MKKETIATHFGYDTKPAPGAMSVPIYASAAYDFGSSQTAANRMALSEFGPIYSRITNPTLDVLETRFAAFEGAAAAISAASGQAATFYAVANLVEAGDNIVVSSKIYSSTLLNHVFKRFGVQSRIFEPDEADGIEELIDERTKLIFFESLSNPQIAVANIDKIVSVAKKHRVITIVDNTVATSLVFAPFKHGIDVAVYSATKYICGQGTTLGGLIASAPWLNSLIKDNPRYPHFNQPDTSYHDLIYTNLPEDLDYYTLRIRLSLLRDIGATLSPQSAFMLIQGLETLNLRMKKHYENALKIAEFLASHPKVKQVNYPPRKGDKFYDRAQKYLENGAASGLLSFDVGSRDAAQKVINSTKIFKVVVNIGDTKSLITHPASTTHSQLDEAGLQKAGISSGTIRLSVGIEDADDLIADLNSALQTI